MTFRLKPFNCKTEKNRVLFDYIARVFQFFSVVVRAEFFSSANKGFRCVTSNRIKCSTIRSACIFSLHSLPTSIPSIFFSTILFSLHEMLILLNFAVFWCVFWLFSSFHYNIFIYFRALYDKPDRDACELENNKIIFFSYWCHRQVKFAVLLYGQLESAGIWMCISARHKHKIQIFATRNWSAIIIIEFPENRDGREKKKREKARATCKYSIMLWLKFQSRRISFIAGSIRLTLISNVEEDEDGKNHSIIFFLHTHQEHQFWSWRKKIKKTKKKFHRSNISELHHFMETI